MAVVSGQRGTLNVLQANRKIDVADTISLLEPDAAPLTTITARMGKKDTHNPQYSWFEDTLDPRFDTQNGGATNSATTVNVNHGTYYGPQDLVYNTRTAEIIRVVSISTNALTVVRAIGGTTGTAMLDGDELLIIGSAAMEGDVSKAARSQNPTQVTNYTQIFRKPVHATETWRHSDQFTSDDDWAYQQKKALIEHKKDIEYAFLLGGSAEDTSGAQPRRTTGGSVRYIQTNQTAVGGALTEAAFFAALRPAFRYGSKTKTLFASALVVDVLNTFPRSKIQVPNQSVDSYGVNVRQFISPHGTVNLVTHWLLEGAKLGGYGILLDMKSVMYRYLANRNGSRDTHINENIQAPDEDGRKDEALSECGLQFGQEKEHALLTGITG